MMMQSASIQFNSDSPHADRASDSVAEEEILKTGGNCHSQLISVQCF